MSDLKTRRTPLRPAVRRRSRAAGCSAGLAILALLLLQGACNGGGDFYREPCYSDCRRGWALCMTYCFDGAGAGQVPARQVPNDELDDDDSATIVCPMYPDSCSDQLDICLDTCRY